MLCRRVEIDNAAARVHGENAICFGRAGRLLNEPRLASLIWSAGLLADRGVVSGHCRLEHISRGVEFDWLPNWKLCCRHGSLHFCNIAFRNSFLPSPIVGFHEGAMLRVVNFV